MARREDKTRQLNDRYLWHEKMKTEWENEAPKEGLKYTLEPRSSGNQQASSADSLLPRNYLTARASADG